MSPCHEGVAGGPTADEHCCRRGVVRRAVRSGPTESDREGGRISVEEHLAESALASHHLGRVEGIDE